MSESRLRLALLVSLVPLLVAQVAWARPGTSGLPPLAPAGDSGRDAESVRVVVALEPMLSVIAAAEPGGERWLEQLVARLEAPAGDASGLEVRGRLLLRGGLLEDSDASEAEAQLLDAAHAAGAEFALIASVTRLIDLFSLEVRAIPVRGPGRVLSTLFEARGEEGLEAALGRAADWVHRELAALPEPAASVETATYAAPGSRSGVIPIADTAAGAEAAALLDGSDSAPRVASIGVDGNQRIETDAILAAIGSNTGEPLSTEQIALDVRRIYALGFFRDVRVTRHDSPDGVVVTFVVEENPVIRRVSVVGNDNLAGDEIKENLTLSVGSTIDYPLLLENKRRIEALYASNGYHLAIVDYEVESLGPDTVGITFDILEGDELRLVSIEFVGNTHFSNSQLLSVMQTKPWRWYSLATNYFDHSGRYVEPIFYQDLDRVVRKYMDAGFIRARVGEPEVTNDGRDLRVVIEVDEGDEYTVGEVGVLGDDTMDQEALEELVELAPGDVFNRSTMTDDVERLRGYYADRGFYYASVTPRTSVDEDGHVVDCEFEVEKGDLYFVDRIEVHGNTRTRDDVVRREFSIAEGELYSADALRRSRARVQRLGFFEEVSLETRESGQTNRIAVDMDVVERPTGAFSFGAGFGSADGFILTGSVRQDNLFGRGYQLSASLNLGGSTHYSYIRFSDPAFLGSVTSLSGTVTQNKIEYSDFSEKLLGFNVTVGYPLDEGETRGYATYSYTGREAFTEEFQASSVVQREEYLSSNTTSMLSLSAVRDTRDDVRFPRSGHSTGFALEYAGLGGLNNFLRLEGRTTWYFPLDDWLPFTSTFVVNSRIGYALEFNTIADFDLPPCSSDQGTLGISCDEFVTSESQPLGNIDTDIELSLTERYFLGGVGAFQLRGFEQRSLGPRRAYIFPVPLENGTGDIYFVPSGRSIGGECQAQGVPLPSDQCNSLDDTEIDEFADLDLTDVIGGNKMFLLNLELRFPLVEDMGLEGLVFLDMGNAFAEDELINPANFRFGTGFGVQWFSPFGPLLMQLGFPLDPLEVEESSVFEFSMGGSQY